MPKANQMKIKTNNYLKKGWWPLRQTWYSICSKHRMRNETCDLCLSGAWYYDVKVIIMQFIFRYNYPLWHWLVNGYWDPDNDPRYYFTVKDKKGK